MLRPNSEPNELAVYMKGNSFRLLDQGDVYKVLRRFRDEYLVGSTPLTFAYAETMPPGGPAGGVADEQTQPHPTPNPAVAAPCLSRPGGNGHRHHPARGAQADGGLAVRGCGDLVLPLRDVFEAAAEVAQRIGAAGVLIACRRCAEELLAVGEMMVVDVRDPDLRTALDLHRCQMN
jgi:hypothetical protein